MHQAHTYLRSVIAVAFAVVVGLILISCDDSVTGPELDEQLIEVTIEGVVVDATNDPNLLEQQGVREQSAPDEADIADPKRSGTDTDADSAAALPADAEERMFERPLVNDGDPIEGATVSTYVPGSDDAEASSTTGSDGTYALTFSIAEDQAPRTLELVTEAEGFANYTSEIDFAPAITYDVALEELAGFTVSGTVVNQYGAGIKDANIEFNSGEKVTSSDVNGRWSQSGLEGTVTISVHKQDYAFETAQITVDSQNRSVNFEGMYQSEPPEGGNVALELSENAKIADEHTASQLVGYEDDYLLFEESTTFLENLEAGDVIALEPNGEVGEDEFIWVVTGDMAGEVEANLFHDGFELLVDPGGWFDFLKPEPQELNLEFALSSLNWNPADPLGSVDIEQSPGEIRVSYNNLLFGEVESGAEFDLEVVDGEILFTDPTFEARLEISPGDSWIGMGEFFLDANLGMEGFLEIKGEWAGDNKISIQFPVEFITGDGSELLKEAIKALFGEYGGWIAEKIVEFLGAISPLKLDVFFDAELEGGTAFHKILQAEVSQAAEVDFGEEEPATNFESTFAADMVCGWYSQDFEGRLASGASVGLYLTTPQGELRGGEIGYAPYTIEVTTETGSGGDYFVSQSFGPAFLLKWIWPFERERWFGLFPEFGYTVEGGAISYIDFAFEQAVRTHISVPEIASRTDRTEDECPLHPFDVDEIVNLDASGQGIASIAGIEAMMDLEVANLSDSQLSEIEPLAALATSQAALLEVDLRNNPSLNVAPGSEARTIIDELENQGVTVYYDEPDTIEVTISGSITDEETGDGIEGATVTGADPATGDELFEITTDAFGDYEIAFDIVDSLSEIAIGASAAGYESVEEQVTVSSNIILNITLILDDTSTPSDVYAPGDGYQYFVSPQTYDSDTDIPALLKDDFGSSTELVDWSDLKGFFAGDLDELLNFLETVGLTEYRDDAFVKRNGSRFRSGSRHYFMQRHDGNVPFGWAVHDQMHSNTVSLGSWPTTKKALVRIPE